MLAKSVYIKLPAIFASARHCKLAYAPQNKKNVVPGSLGPASQFEPVLQHDHQLSCNHPRCKNIEHELNSDKQQNFCKACQKYEAIKQKKCKKISFHKQSFCVNKYHTKIKRLSAARPFLHRIKNSIASQCTKCKSGGSWYMLAQICNMNRKTISEFLYI